MPTTYDGEVIFSIGYSGSVLSGPGRYDSEILQTSAFSNVNPQKTKGFLGQNIAPPTNSFYVTGVTKDTKLRTNNSYGTVSWSGLSGFSSQTKAQSPRLQKLYNSTSRKFVTYYSMIAKDTGAATTTYRTWVSKGSPGSVTDYQGPKNGTLTDLSIAAKWKVYL